MYGVGEPACTKESDNGWVLSSWGLYQWGLASLLVFRDFRAEDQLLMNALSLISQRLDRVLSRRFRHLQMEITRQ